MSPTPYSPAQPNRRRLIAEQSRRLAALTWSDRYRNQISDMAARVAAHAEPPATRAVVFCNASTIDFARQQFEHLHGRGRFSAVNLIRGG